MTIPFYEMTAAQLDERVIATCKECHGSGVCADDESCDCLPEYHRALERAQFPLRLAHASLAEFDWQALESENLRNKLREYAEHVTDCLDQNLGLFLTGPVGCGKTHLIVGIARIACALGANPLFVSVPEWFQSLRDSYADSRQTNEHKLLTQLREADLLILDDLGAERSSDWVRERLYLVINDRYVRERPTWVTTNLTVEELNATLGERSVSRLVSDAVVFTLEGDDYRHRQKQNRVTELRMKWNQQLQGSVAVSRVPMLKEK